MPRRVNEGLLLVVACLVSLAWAATRAIERSTLRLIRLGRTVLREVPSMCPMTVTWAAPHARELLIRLATARVWVRPHVVTLIAHVHGVATRRRVIRVARRAFILALVATTVAGAGAALIEPGVELAAHVVDVDASAPFAPLPGESTVVAADGSALGVIPGGTHRIAVSLDAVPERVRSLVLAAEDRRFYEHEGYDESAILRAAVANLRAGEVEQGGSTITQQLAKRNFTGDDRTPLRKARELAYAAALEERLSKHRLLERYLNEVYFGARAYGIAAAARTYFGVGVDALDVEQAALLAAVVRAPSFLDPWSNPDAVKVRRDAVLRLAAEDGRISHEELANALAAPLGVLPQPARPSPPETQIVAAVEDEVAMLDAAGGTPDRRLDALRTGQWRVETSIMPALQDAARNALARRLGDGVSGAVAMVEPGSGRVLALVAHQPRTTSPFPLATRARRQPGSTFKAIAAIAGLEAGLRTDQKFEGRGPRRFDVAPEDWVVDNFDEADYGEVDLATALRDSVNTAFAQLSVAVGADALADVAERVGIPVEAALGAPSERGPALGLGGLHRGVSPLELASAYATIAADGRAADARVIDRIVDRRGRVVYERPGDSRAVVDPSIAAAVRTMLQAVVAEGTGRAARIEGWAPLGKTGTSQDRADAWFVGSLPHLAAAVWVGHSDRREPMPSATGGTTAAPIWREAVVPGLDVAPTFPAPPPLAEGTGIDLPKALPCDTKCARSG